VLGLWPGVDQDYATPIKVTISGSLEAASVGGLVAPTLQESFHLEDGPVTFSFPATLSADSIKTYKIALRSFFAK
jgi:hypothetical protein